MLRGYIRRSTEMLRQIQAGVKLSYGAFVRRFRRNKSQALV
jgi:hypothetical protein